MGNVVGIGWVTKIWRVDWEDAGGDEAVGQDPRAKSKADDRRRWCEVMAKCDSEEKLMHWIVIRHYESGKVAVFVDGAFTGNGNASFSSCELKYRVGKRLGCTRITFNDGGKLAYSFSTCLIMPSGAEMPLKELNETLMNNHDPSIIQIDVTSAVVENQPARASQTAPLQAVALYEVTTRVREDERIVMRKRFSEFVELDRFVRSAFQDSHLLSSIPNLPPRQFKALSNHLSAEFIEKRRTALRHYLRKLVTVPRISSNPDVLEFLGILPRPAVSSISPEVVV